MTEIYKTEFNIRLVYPLFAETFKGLAEQYQIPNKEVYYFDEILVEHINKILNSDK